MNKQSPLWLTLALGFLVLCMGVILITGPLQAPVEWRGFWNVQQQPAVTQVVEAQAPTTQVIVVTATHQTPVTATAEPAKVNNVDWVIGGRNDDAGKYYMYIAAANPETIVAGTPLQAYYSQVVSAGFVNNLEIAAKHEVFNDGVKIVIHGDKAFFMPDDNATVPHSTISWLQYIEGKGILVCHDDSGVSGTWIGDCAGTTQMITEWIPIETLLTSGKFQPWAEKFLSVRDSYDGMVFNNHIQLLVTFR